MNEVNAGEQNSPEPALLFQEQVARELGLAVMGLRFYTRNPFNIKTGSETLYDSTNETVYISPEQLQEWDIDPAGLGYIIGHEVGHVLQEEEDKEAYIEGFVLTSQLARQRTLAYCQSRGIENDIAKSLVNSYFTEVFKRFRNSIRDINANARHTAISLHYNKGYSLQGTEREVYQKAFPTDDFTDQPLSMQFANRILITAMDPERRLVVSPQVEKASKKQIKGIQQQRFTQVLKEPNCSVAQINNMLASFGPIIAEMAEADLDNTDIKPLEDDLQELQDVLQQLIDSVGEAGPALPLELEETAKQIGKGLITDAVDLDRPYEIAVDKQIDKRKKRELKEQGASKREAKRIVEELRRVASTRNGLVELWHKIRTSQVTRTEEEKLGKTGFDLDTEAAVRDYAQIQTSPSTARVMRTVEERVETKKGLEELLIFFVADVSGSMGEEDKLELIKFEEVLLGSAVQFGQEQITSQEEGLVRVNPNIIFFGTTFDGPHLVEEFDDLLERQLETYKLKMGKTHDWTALEEVEEHLKKPEIIAKIQTGNLVPVVIEITDGGSHSVSKTRQVVDRLAQIPNIIMGAWQVKGSEEDQEKFQGSWGDRGKIQTNWQAVYPQLEDLIKKGLKKFIKVEERK